MNLEDLVGPIEWVREGKGYIMCPAEELHSTPTKRKDTILYTDNVPTIFCLHSQCKGAIREANVALRAALRGEGWTPKKPTAEQREAYARRQELTCKCERLAKYKEEVLDRYAWPVSDILKDSAPITDEWQQFLNLWPESDIMWSGDPMDSGQYSNAANFKTVRLWKQYATSPYPFVCGTAFRAGSYSRTKDSVQDRRFIVVECDDLDPNPEVNKNLSGAVINFVRQRGWTLRAIVDSGNKSIHGWFEYPSEEQEEWATYVLPALNVDTATLRPTQPVRAVGIERENGNKQKLLWIN